MGYEGVGILFVMGSLTVSAVAVAVWLIRGERARVASGVAALAEREARNTGVWVTADVSWDQSEVLSVRWDPVIRRYFMRSEVDVDWVCWPDVEALAQFLILMEGEGFVPERDGPTTAIRARLDLPGWWEDWSKTRRGGVSA